MDCLIDVPLNDNSHLMPSQYHSTCSSLKNNTQMASTSLSKNTCPNSSLDHQDPSLLFHNNAFWNYYICLMKFSVQHHFDSTSNTIMNVTDYWPMAREYAVWNTTVAALQFWTANLKDHVLSSTIEHVHNAFFYSTSTHQLCQQSDEVLFGCIMTTLNAAFESKFALEDEGYESGSDNFNMPTPPRRTSKIHHVSSDENISFDPSTPCSTGSSQSHCKPVWHLLTFSSSDDEDTFTVDNPLPSSIAPLQNPIDLLPQLNSKCTLTICDDLDDDEEEEEDFQTVSLEDDHWTMEEIPDWPLCIYEHSLPHELCSYQCPYLDYTSSLYYNTLDLSDISEFEDLMIKSSDEDIPMLDDVGYWSLWTMVSKWTFICN